MSLPILLATIVIGVMLIVAVLQFTGAGSRLKLENADQVRKHFMLDDSEFNATEIIISANGACAFVLMDGGRTGIARVVGRHVATRIITHLEVASMSSDSQGTVTIVFRDFGWSRIEAHLESLDDAARLMHHANPLSANG